MRVAYPAYELQSLYLKRDGVYNPVTHVSKAIEPSKRFGRGCKPRPALRIALSENDALHYRSAHPIKGVIYY